MTGLANASQGATINGFEDSVGTITFSVEDSAAALAANAAAWIWLTMSAWVQTATMNSLLVRQMLLTALMIHHAGGYTISDDAVAVSGSSVEILGDSDSVTVTGLANASQGATINGFADSVGTITFSVEDSAAALAANGRPGFG